MTPDPLRPSPALTPQREAIPVPAAVQASGGGEPTVPIAERIAPWFGTGLVLAAFVWQAAIAWNKEPDVFIDFGRELYVPWRLAEGDALYRDLAYFSGPVSPFFNALVFTLFHPGVRVLALVNLMIAAALVEAIYLLALATTDQVAATATALFIVMVFVFPQYEWVGGSNYICPYSHEVTHGLALSAGGLLLWRSWFASGKNYFAALAGLCLGTTFLVKIEFFLALFAASVAALFAAWVHAPSRTAKREPSKPAVGPWRGGSALLLSAVVPVLLAYCVLAVRIGPQLAWDGVIGSWGYLARPGVATSPFYLRSMGLDQPAMWLGQTLTAFGIEVAALTLLAALALAVRGARLQRPRVQWPLAAATFAAVALALHAAKSGIDLSMIWRPLPLYVLSLVLLTGTRLLRAGAAAGPSERLSLVLTTFAATALLKIGLHARIENYGVFLAMPAAATWTATLFGPLRRWIARRGGGERVFAAGLAAAFGSIAWWHAQASANFYSFKTYRVGRGLDTLVADERGNTVNVLLERIERLARPNETVLALPEGEILNYLARRGAGTPYFHLMPPEIRMFGEEAIRASLEQSPPDFIILLHKDTTEYGVPLFGTDYGTEIMAWIKDRYSLIEQFGPAPFVTPSQFGVQILRRKAPAVTSSPGAS